MLTVLRLETSIGEGLVALQALLNLALWDPSEYAASCAMVAAAAVLNKWGPGTGGGTGPVLQGSLLAYFPFLGYVITIASSGAMFVVKL